MTGTPNQVEWAVLIKPRVDAEFDRVAEALKTVAAQQVDQDRADTEALLGVLEQKRGEVMANDCAGYFIRDWQEITDQVRCMIARDPRHKMIQASKAARRSVRPNVTDRS
jgi:hypothetical protein